MQNARGETTATGKLIEEVFGRKLKQVISVVAIEQATQRTAEWAQQINQASKNLGTTAEQLQTLNHIASATGVADSAVTGLFDNIQKSAQDAIKGNGDLIASFNKLGMSVGDLMSMTNADIFSKVIANIPKNIRTTSDQYMRQSVQHITGTPENTLMSIQAGYNTTPGADLTGKGTNLKNQGAIAGEDNIQELSAVWAQFMTSIKESGTLLLPLAGILVSIAKTLVDAFNGVADIIKNILTLNLGHALAQIVGVVVNGGAGVAKMVIGLFGHIPGMKKFAAAWSGQINEGQDVANKALGLGGIDKQRQEAIGNVATMVATAGEGNLASIGAYGAKGVSAGAGKLGMKGLATKAGKLGDKFAVTASGLTDPAIAKDIGEILKRERLKRDGGGAEEMAQNSKLPPSFDATYNKIKRGRAGLAGAAGLGAGAFGLKGISDAVNSGNQDNPQNIKPIGLPMSFQQMAGGSANLKTGGMFGTGSLMDKLVSLNQRMSEHLATIAKNTGHGKPGGMDDTLEKHNKTLQGHGMIPGGGSGGGAGAGGGW